MKHALLLLLLFTSSLISAQAVCTDGRFKDPIFPNYQIINDIQFGHNIQNNGEPLDLYLDVYMPSVEEDTFKVRPLIFLMFGGSFVGGSKEVGNIKMLGREFAKRGYVAVAVQYRLEQAQNSLDNPILEFADRKEWYSAIMRGAHDLKAAVRYLKYTVSDLGNPYAVDTNNITLYGSSAGAIAVLHAFYLDESDEMKPAWKSIIKSFGGIEGNSNDYSFSSMNTVKNLILDSGAIDEIDWMTEDENYANVLAMQYKNDPSVPFNHGCFYTAFCHLDKFYGTKFFAPKAASIGARVETYELEGINHPVQDNNPEFVLEKSVNFLYDFQCDYYSKYVAPTSVRQQEISTFNIYPNPNNGNFRLDVKDISVGSRIQLHSVSGQLVHEEKLQSANNYIQINDLAEGVYFVSFIRPNGHQSVSKLVVKK